MKNPMERLSKHLALLVMVLHSPSFWAQDPFFLQYDLLPMCINPAIAGADSGMHWTNVHNNQWPSLPGIFLTHASAMDHGTADGKLGFGMMVMNDQAGPALSTNSISLMPSYGLNLSEGRQLRLGATLGYVRKSLDLSNAMYWSMIDSRHGIIYTPSTTLTETTAHFGSAGLGMAYIGRRLSGGLSALHINEPNQGLVMESSILPMRIHAHAQLAIPLFRSITCQNEESPENLEPRDSIPSNDSTEIDRKVKIPNGDLILQALYMRQGGFETMVVGLKRQMKNGFRLGVSFWGYENQGGQVALTAGMAWHRIQLDYGLGTTYSLLSPTNSVTHNVTIGVAFGTAYRGDQKARKAKGRDFEPQFLEAEPVEE